MLLTQDKLAVKNTMTGESSQMSIQLTRKTFDVLVSGIYSDKIGSIVRELVSNAFDSHRRNGNEDQPFEVRLPNSLNPTFSVRDYGTSMAHDYMMGPYNTLFYSDKTGSNAEVGGFGLGAKTYLAYTDACTVNCWQDGELRAYSTALNEEGIPTLHLVHRAPSDEPTGVEVTFAVMPQDFGKFAEAMRHVLLGLDVKPVIVGSDVTAPEPVFQGKFWRMFKNMGRNNYLRQGCAVYPLNLYSTNLPYGFNLIIDVPIGQANVTASREALALTREQERAIDNLARAAVVEMNKQVQAEYHSLGTALEKAWFAHHNSAILGQGNWPTSVKLPHSLVQWTSQSPFDSFRVERIQRIKIVRDDGTKLVRQARRMKALAGNYDVYVVQDPNVIAEARVLLGLKPDQVIKMSEVPDVYVPPRKPSTVTKKVLTSTRVWAHANRNDAWAGNFRWNKTSGAPLGYGHRYHTAVASIIDKIIADSGDPILYLTPNEHDKAVAKGLIVESNRLDLLVEAQIAKFEKDYQTTTLIRAFDSMHQQSVRAEMLAKAGLPSATTMNTDVEALFEIFFPKQAAIYKAEQVALRQKMANRYPLLFGFDIHSVKGYIAAMDKAAI